MCSLGGAALLIQSHGEILQLLLPHTSLALTAVRNIKGDKYLLQLGLVGGVSEWL